MKAIAASPRLQYSSVHIVTGIELLLSGAILYIHVRLCLWSNPPLPLPFFESHEEKRENLAPPKKHNRAPLCKVRKTPKDLEDEVCNNQKVLAVVRRNPILTPSSRVALFFENVSYRASRGNIAWPFGMSQPVRKEGRLPTSIFIIEEKAFRTQSCNQPHMPEDNADYFL